MKVNLSLLFSLFICIALAKGQNNGTPSYEHKGVLFSEGNLTITGIIVDEKTKNPLEYTTISLYSLKDSSIVIGTLSDEKGKFFIETNLEMFFLKIEFIAYQAKTIDRIRLTNKQGVWDLGIIELMPILETLQNVEVRAEKSSVMMSLDKRVFNVEKDLVSEGGTAEDILKNVPGVWIDINGNVSLRSSGSARILLNGQPSLLIDGENSDGLRQIQANAIDRIEIITNPSARYEAAGTAGIINIILKKNEQKGLNGSVTSNVGHPDNFGLGVNMNYRKNKLNFFTGMGAWYVNRPGLGNHRNRFFNLENSDSTLYVNMDRTHEQRGLPINFRIGADYYFNPKNTLTTSFYYRTNKDKNTSELIYKDAFGSPEHIHLITKRQEKETEKERNLSAFLRHKKSFAKKGHQVTTDIWYEKETVLENSFYEETYFDGENRQLDTSDFSQITSNNSGNEVLILKSYYVLPLGKESKFEGGFQSSFRSITADYSAKEIIDNLEMADTNFVNNFKYEEIIHALYANYGNKIERFSFQTGLRVEYADIESGLAINGENNISQSINYFPNAFIGYDLFNDSGLKLSYSRRIERPTFLDLTPFFTLRDRRNIWRGNPEIRPEFTHIFELGYIKYWDRGTLSAIAYFRKTDDVIKRIQRVDERFPETTITQAENIDIKRNYGIELTYSLLLTKWWRLNGDLNLFHSFSGGTYEFQRQETYVGGESFSLTSKTISRFTFWDKLNSQLTLSYSAPRTTTQGVNKAMIALDFATSIDMLKNNGTATLSIRDLFNSRRRRSFSEDETFYSEDNFLWQSRAIVLSFHYRINQQKKQSQIYSSPIKENDEERF
ncbi:MAG: ferric enterobactin receptor [Paraglaciecola sp.]|jgi:ferric enterobactin receptor